jgi:capsular polysaccharide biosynthesis protein
MRDGNVIVSPNDGSGWFIEHIDYALSEYRSHTHELSDQSTFCDGVVALLSFAGGYTFGHWVVDICPRIEILSRYFNLKDLRFAVPGPLPIWAEPFLSAYCIKTEQLVPLMSGSLVTVQDLAVPHIGRLTDCLFEFPHLAAFNRLKTYGIEKFPEAKGLGKKILVKHTPMTSNGSRSVLGNFDDIETKLNDIGFVTIEPASMSLEEQIGAFSEAEIIVGEDSSALHNVIYSNNAELFVISSPDRPNLLHLSIAELLGHRICYISGDTSSDGRFKCEVDKITELFVQNHPTS